MAKKTPTTKTVEVIKHEDKRKNIPTAEFQSVMAKDDESPIQVAYQHCNRDMEISKR